MSILFEFDNEILINNPQGLRNYLQEVWEDQYASLRDWEDERGKDPEYQQKRVYQPFLRFDGSYIRARNYVGFIQMDEIFLEIYPKVFKAEAIDAKMMLRHLFFWFEFCRKWKFPFLKSNLDILPDVELPELIIYLMAAKMLDTVSSMPISLYQSIEESLYAPKGRINFAKYLSTGFANGNHHLIDCNYEPFVFDNQLNRIIKYTSQLLLKKTKFEESQSVFKEIIFILDEVEDLPCNHLDLETIVVNPLFSEYEDVKNICKMVLQQSLYGNQPYELSNWCLFFPMEYIFEDFIAGFIEAKFSDIWKVEYQKSNLNLSTNPTAFRMQHDIFLTLRKDASRKIIVDTKYKLRSDNFKDDSKKGISQADLYQVVSYALRRGVNEVLLLYPNSGTIIREPDNFLIESGFNGKDTITVIAAELPFWSKDDFGGLTTQLQTVLNTLLR